MTKSLVLFISQQRAKFPIILLCLSILILLPINLSAEKQYVFPSDINSASERRLSERYYKQGFYGKHSEQNFYSRPISGGNKVRKYRFPDGSEYEIKLGPTAPEYSSLDSKNEQNFSAQHIDSIQRFKNKLKISRFPNHEKDNNHYKMRSNNNLLYKWPEEHIMKTITHSSAVEKDGYYQQKYTNTLNSTEPPYKKQGYAGIGKFSDSSLIYPFRNEVNSFNPLLRGLPGTYPGYLTSEHIVPFRTRFPGSYQHGFFYGLDVPQGRKFMEPYNYPRR